MAFSETYNCIIIDDNELDRLTTLAFVRRYPILNILGVYASAQEALGIIESQQVQVLFSDIDMPELSGLALRAQAQYIPVCIFITAYPDYAAEGFEANAFDFLIKPIRGERFAQSITRVQEYLQIRQKAELFEYSLGGNTLFIKDGHTQIKLNLHDVLYLEALKDYTRIVTKSKKYTVLSSIGQLLKEPVFGSFVRIHRSYAVQRHYIERITSQEVSIQQYTLPIGRSYKEALSQLK